MEIITLSQFQNEFNLVFNKSFSKNYIIDNEINEIHTYINTTQSFKVFQKPKTHSSTNNLKGTFKKLINKQNDTYFSRAFNDYMLEGKHEIEISPDDSSLAYDYKLKTSKQAYEFAEYYKWLEKLKQQPQKIEKKNSLSHKEKMLALFYLGLDMRKFNNNVQSANILSQILDLDESNTKRYLTYFEGNKGKVKTENNIKKMLELFEHQDFKNIQKKIKDDLKK
ncbi:hypothetical protein RCH33_564 [Flavobacterium daejeonense]|nr:hypothetical protein RCH33_564 [Flavobacterium daejeonense]